MRREMIRCCWTLLIYVFYFTDGKNAYSSKRRLRPDMISSPQGDLKHTGHVGLDGAYFGDVAFLGDKVCTIIMMDVFVCCCLPVRQEACKL